MLISEEQAREALKLKNSNELIEHVVRQDKHITTILEILMKTLPVVEKLQTRVHELEDMIRGKEKIHH